MPSETPPAVRYVADIDRLYLRTSIDQAAGRIAVGTATADGAVQDRLKTIQRYHADCAEIMDLRRGGYGTVDDAFGVLDSVGPVGRDAADHLALAADYLDLRETTSRERTDQLAAWTGDAPLYARPVYTAFAAVHGRMQGFTDSSLPDQQALVEDVRDEYAAWIDA